MSVKSLLFLLILLILVFDFSFTWKEGMKNQAWYDKLGAISAWTIRSCVGTNSLPPSKSVIMGDA